MASGDSLFYWDAHSAEFPTANPGVPSARNQHPIVSLTVTDIVILSFVLPRNYAATTGITVYMHYAMASATANDIVLDTTFERIGDQQQDLDADGFDATGVGGGEITVPGTSGLVDIINNAHTDGARLAGLLVGEGGRLKITRVAAAGTDATGDLELRFVELKET